jgi:ML domain
MSRILVCIISVLLLQISSLAAHDFELCGTDHLGISVVDIQPDPVNSGASFTVSVSGSPDQLISSGTLKLDIYLGSKDLYSLSYDICTEVGLTCPIQAGQPFTASITETLPKLPKITVKAVCTAEDSSGQQLTCVQTDVQIV